MTDVNDKSEPIRDPWGSFEPYVQLVRSLLPRATSVALYDGTGELRWSSETTTGPDLHDRVESALQAGGASPQGPGIMRLLDGNLPVYLCWVRDDSDLLIGVVVVVCRQTGDPDAEGRGFTFAHSLLRPALECLRRDLLSQAAIESLHRTVSSRDKDLELLLADGSAERPAGDGADELKGVLTQMLDHIGAATAALIVPDKSIALLR